MTRSITTFLAILMATFVISTSSGCNYFGSDVEADEVRVTFKDEVSTTRDVDGTKITGVGADLDAAKADFNVKATAHRKAARETAAADAKVAREKRDETDSKKRISEIREGVTQALDARNLRVETKPAAKKK
jgi:hypothetical protein